MKISVIIPFYNEADNVKNLIQETYNVLNSLNNEFEIIAVDDGSTDLTNRKLTELSKEIINLKIIKHTKNFGQGQAFWTGFQKAAFDIIVTLDGDGQNDPSDIPMLLSHLKDCDAVFGQRAKRNDPLRKRIASKFANWIRSKMLGDNIRDSSCSLKVLKKNVIFSFLPVKGFYRFIPFLVKQNGFRFKTVNVRHRPREFEKTKYSLRKLYFLAPAADLLFMYWYKKNRLKN